MTRLIEWFVPTDKIANRTDRDLASIFIFTHLCGPLLAQPMWAYLWYATTAAKPPLLMLIVMTWSFVLLPFILRWTGRIRLVAMLSFQLLAVTSLFAAFHYGGFNSPFLPWLIVSLLLGLFYQSRNYLTVLGLFALDVALFVFLVTYYEQSASISIDQMDILGWLSISSATVYVTWMALYYSRIVGLKSELESEVEKSRQTSIELERARTTAEDLGIQRSRFFAKMGHELRTPLNAIIGYSEILLEDLEYAGRKDDSRQADVLRIQAAGKHLMSLVSHVLDDNALTDGADRIEVSAVALREICDAVTATVMPNVEKAGNQFIVTCHDPSYILETDATKLRQVIINLLSNAAKFTKNGVIKLDLAVIAQADRTILRAAVSDTGIGMSPEGLSRIFRNYEQAEVETVAQYGGTGIGLALSQHLAQLMGGEISVKSVPGRGSCFTAWIPTRCDPIASPPPAKPTTSKTPVLKARRTTLNLSGPKGSLA